MQFGAVIPQTLTGRKIRHHSWPATAMRAVDAWVDVGGANATRAVVADGPKVAVPIAQLFEIFDFGKVSL